MKIAVITGASSGMGRELAVQVLKKNSLTKFGSLPDVNKRWKV